jgi:glycosyltransferase involved in cell wall biosynthesis
LGGQIIFTSFHADSQRASNDQPYKNCQKFQIIFLVNKFSESTPKVCIFTETYYPVIGGGETQAKSFAESLVSFGFQVVVLTRRSQPGYKKIERLGKVTVYRTPPVGPEHLKKWGLLVMSVPYLIRLRQEYELIFVSGFRVIGVSAVLMKKFFGKRCVLKADNNGEMSGSFFAAGMAKFRLKPGSFPFGILLAIRNKILMRADHFVAISSDIYNELISCGVNPSKVFIIPNSVDENLYHPVSGLTKRSFRKKLSLPMDWTIITYTGRLVSYKGLPLLLKVWKKIQTHYKNALLLLVGSGSMDIHNCEDEIKDYVRTEGLHNTVLLTGEVRNVNEYLQASDIFVFPTEKEAFGISLLEAMACGRPVISTNVGGVKDILEHGKNGLVVRPGDSQELYRALDTLISDTTLSAYLGHNARLTVQDKYTTEIVAREYVDLFTNISNS